MIATALHSPRGRRTVVVAAATITFGALATVGPVSLTVPAQAAGTVPASTGSLVGALTATGVASVVGTTTTAPATPTTAVVTTTAASRSTARTAVSPYRVGTKAYSQWFAKSYMASKYKWTATKQYTCLVKLWHRESGWSHTSHNRRSGAHGIPQALPGSKMAKAGPNWRTNPVTQIKWGLGYIKSRYGTPCGAWSQFQRRGWY